MIAVATSKAARRKAPAQFQVAAAQSLPFPDATFDAVVTSLMLHHLPEQDRLPAVGELLRVLQPGGTLVIAEFQSPTGPTPANSPTMSWATRWPATTWTPSASWPHPQQRPT
jgi:ubiquinone/menaquinone biosynthesis C-methylase UbiE